MASVRPDGGIQTDYDPIVDVLHISLVDSDHAAYGDNVDDMVIVMRAVESDLLLGFEILDAKRHGARKVREALLPIIQAEKDRIQRASRDLCSRLDELERARLQDMVPA